MSENEDKQNFKNKIASFFTKTWVSLLFLILFGVSICGIVTISVIFYNTNKKYQQQVYEMYLERIEQQQTIDLLEEQVDKLENERQLSELRKTIEQAQQKRLQVIEMVKNTRDSDTGKTYGDIVQSIISDGAKRFIEYKWDVSEKPEYDTYLVSFVDTDEERGSFWEVNLSTNIVRYVSDNWQLKIQYGLTPLRHNNIFSIVEVISEEIIANQSSYYSNTENGIIYKIVASVKNNTDKNITSCSFGADLVVIYSEQKIIEERANRVSFSRPSVSEPWKPNRVKEITIYTKPYDYIYKNYDPLIAFCYITLSAKDPLGYEYSGAFAERNITKLFEKLQ